MRDIIFRGKGNEKYNSGGWYFGGGIGKDCDGDYYIQDNSFRWTIIPGTVCQYTGLADKNGKKIFEGDIIKHFYNPSGDEYDIGIVKWDSEDCMFFRTSKEFDDDKILSNHCEYEIIGNIHDNPELMREVEV